MLLNLRFDLKKLDEFSVNLEMFSFGFNKEQIQVRKSKKKVSMHFQVEKKMLNETVV